MQSKELKIKSVTKSIEIINSIVINILLFHFFFEIKKLVIHDWFIVNSLLRLQILFRLTQRLNQLSERILRPPFSQDQSILPLFSRSTCLFRGSVPLDLFHFNNELFQHKRFMQSIIFVPQQLFMVALPLQFQCLAAFIRSPHDCKQVKTSIIKTMC